MFSAVKKPDEKMFTPENTNAIENILKAKTVRSNSSLSYPTKSMESGTARASAAAASITPEKLMTIRLFLNRFFSSSLLPEP